MSSSFSFVVACFTKKGEDGEKFNPAYAVIDRLIHGDTIAKKCGLQAGDCIVAVNGEGFRRFAPEYDQSSGEIDELTTNLDGSVSISFDYNDENDSSSGVLRTTEEQIKEKEQNRQLKYRVIPSGMNGGEAYQALVREIHKVKTANDPENPLLLSLERYGWDSRVNSWPRFLKARNNLVPEAFLMIQNHEKWKQNTFPIDLRRPGLRVVLKSIAMAEIRMDDAVTPPTVYVDFGKLMALEGNLASSNDMLDAFILNTELLLSSSSDAIKPKVCQFIDLTEANLRSLNASILQEIYAVFEPNYPETLEKMVMYPVTKAVVS